MQESKKYQEVILKHLWHELSSEEAKYLSYKNFYFLNHGFIYKPHLVLSIFISFFIHPTMSKHTKIWDKPQENKNFTKAFNQFS